MPGSRGPQGPQPHQPQGYNPALRAELDAFAQNYEKLLKLVEQDENAQTLVNIAVREELDTLKTNNERLVERVRVLEAQMETKAEPVEKKKWWKR